MAIFDLPSPASIPVRHLSAIPRITSEKPGKGQFGATAATLDAWFIQTPNRDKKDQTATFASLERQPMIDFFEFSNEMLSLANSQGYLTRVNPAWTKTLGWTAEELTGRPYLDFVHPEDLEATLKEAELLAGGTHETIGFENRYRHRDGSYRWLAWRVIVPPGSHELVVSRRA